MTLYRLQYVFSPTAPFGLPDGDKLVLPAGPRTFVSPSIHFKSGAISSHGTLPEYRAADQALAARVGDESCALALDDNYGVLTLEADSAQRAYELGNPIIERLCHGLSIQTGQRFSAVLQFIEDDADNVSVRQSPLVL